MSTRRKRRILRQSAKGIDTYKLKELSAIDADEYLPHDDHAGAIFD